MTTTPAQKSRSRLVPRVRDYLAQWPAGEVRSMGDVRTATHYTNMEHLVTEGYLTPAGYVPGSWGAQQYGKHSNHLWWRDDAQFQRTTKVCHPYKARSRTSTRYKGLFPWSVEDHWRRVEKSPMRSVREVASRLTGRTTTSAELKLAYPILVRTRAELNAVRKVLVTLFGATDPTWKAGTTTRQQMALQYGWLPQGVQAVLTHGHGLRLLLLELLVEPVFDAHGALVRFQPVDAEAARAELEALYGDGTVTEKYQHYMATRRPPLSAPRTDP